MKKHILYLGPMCFRCQEVTRSTMQNRQYKNDVFFVLRTHEKETLEGSFVDPKRFGSPWPTEAMHNSFGLVHTAELGEVNGKRQVQFVILLGKSLILFLPLLILLLLHYCHLRMPTQITPQELL